MPTELVVPTDHGPARVVVREASGPAAALVLSHGAGRGVDSLDLVAVAESLADVGVSTYLVEQPWVARGRKVADRPAVLDACLTTVLNELSLTLPLILGGRSAGARSSLRVANAHDAVGCVAMSFPLHPPGRPERSRADELTGAEVPTVVIQGERDPMGRPEEFPAGTDLRVVPYADHGYSVAKSAPVTPAETIDLVAHYAREWILTDLLPTLPRSKD